MVIRPISKISASDLALGDQAYVPLKLILVFDYDHQNLELHNLMVTFRLVANDSAAP